MLRNAADTRSVLTGSGITNARTACIGALAARELDAETFRRADAVVADVPAEVAETGDLRATDLSAADLVPLSSVLAGDVERESPSAFFIVDSVGSAVLDPAAVRRIRMASSPRTTVMTAEELMTGEARLAGPRPVALPGDRGVLRARDVRRARGPHTVGCNCLPVIRRAVR
jgi:alanine dehydrogenase